MKLRITPHCSNDASAFRGASVGCKQGATSELYSCGRVRLRRKLEGISDSVRKQHNATTTVVQPSQHNRFNRTTQPTNSNLTTVVTVVQPYNYSAGAIGVVLADKVLNLFVPIVIA